MKPIHRLPGLTAMAALVAALVGAAPADPTAGAPQAPHVAASDVMPYLVALQRIADRDGGNRAHGTKGYRDSLTYVKHVLDTAGFRTTVQHFSYAGTTGYNLLADWPGGDPGHVIMAGAHLDSVAAGPGINDNGSGSAAVLATAVAVSKARLRTERHLRFAWWGAEEPGMIGSAHYVAHLSAAQRRAIDSYSNFDQAGSKNVQVRIVTHDDPAAADAYESYFAAQGLPTLDVEGAAGSDHVSFLDAGIPVGGFSTGISDCIHTACDDIGNVDPAVETDSANAIVSATWRLATTRNG